MKIIVCNNIKIETSVFSSMIINFEVAEENGRRQYSVFLTNFLLNKAFLYTVYFIEIYSLIMIK